VHTKARNRCAWRFTIVRQISSFTLTRLYPIAAGEKPLIGQALFSHREFFRISPIQRGELENIVNAQIAAIVVLSRHLKWIKSSLRSVGFDVIAAIAAARVLWKPRFELIQSSDAVVQWLDLPHSEFYRPRESAAVNHASSSAHQQPDQG
jgi:hypothetical protein